MQSYTLYNKVYKAFLDDRENIIDTFNPHEKRYIVSGWLLHTALENNDLPFFEYLLKYSPNVNHKSCRGFSILESAVVNKNLDIVKSLLNHGAAINVQTRNPDGGTLLHTAIRFNNVEMVKLLLEKGIEVNKSGNYSRFPYVDSIKLNCVHSQLSGNGVPIHIFEIYLRKDTTPDYKQMHPLHLAIIVNCDLVVIEKLIEYGADINSVCRKKCTPLSHAVARKVDKNIIFYLLKKGATFNVDTIDEVLDEFLLLNPIVCEQIFTLLVDSGADLQRQTYYNKVYEAFLDNKEKIDTLIPHKKRDTVSGYLLYTALEKKHFPFFEYLLKNNANVNYQSPLGFSVLESAVVNNNLDIVKSLVNHGADINVRTKNPPQGTLLHAATLSNCDLILIDKLIEYGVNINSVCRSQWTPLCHAVMTMNKNKIFYLLKKGATFNVNTINTVLDKLLSAKSIVCEQILTLLVDSGADINAKDTSGFPDLHKTIIERIYYEYNLRLALDYGYNLNAQDEDGNTLLHLACKEIKPRILEILLEYKANLTLLNAEGQTPLTISSYQCYDIKRTNHESYIILYIIIKSIVTNAELGKHVDANDLKYVKTKFPDMYDCFKNELEKAKSKKVRRNISYYDILKKSVSVLKTYFNTSIDVLETIESSNIEDDFSTYSEMLRIRIRKIKERKILVEFSEKYFKTLFHLEYEPPILITDLIISYLSSVDLITLWRVFRRDKEQNLWTFLNRSKEKDIKLY